MNDHLLGINRKYYARSWSRLNNLIAARQFWKIKNYAKSTKNILFWSLLSKGTLRNVVIFRKQESIWYQKIYEHPFVSHIFFCIFEILRILPKHTSVSNKSTNNFPDCPNCPTHKGCHFRKYFFFKKTKINKKTILKMAPLVGETKLPKNCPTYLYFGQFGLTH